MAGPLAGVRVADLSRVLNGPFCTMLLGHLGAEIIKVETRKGDSFRHIWQPPGVKKDAYEFIIANSNKKSITLNLKTERGKSLLHKLVSLSDVLVENFSQGVMECLGLDYQALRAINPRLIYACTRGFGDSGPRASFRAVASTNMAVSGWQHTAWKTSGHYGTKVLGVGDEAGGVSLALGIIAALYARQQTGSGQKIEVSMQEALLGFMSSSLHAHFEGVAPGISPKKAADGYYNFRLPDIDDERWACLCRAMGRDDLREDPRFSSSHARQQNSKTLEEIISGWMQNKTRGELWQILSSELGLASAPVLTLEEVIKDSHLQERKAFVKIDHTTCGPVLLLEPWIRMSETPASIRSPAPAIGQHNEEVYCGLLGLNKQELDILIAEGVV